MKRLAILAATAVLAFLVPGWVYAATWAGAASWAAMVLIVSVSVTFAWRSGRRREQAAD